MTERLRPSKLCAAAMLQDYLIRRAGNPTMAFLQFYHPFTRLYMPTKYQRDLSEIDNNITNAIEKWINYKRNPVTMGQINQRLKLFSLYQRELVKKGIVVL